MFDMFMMKRWIFIGISFNLLLAVLFLIMLWPQAVVPETARVKGEKFEAPIRLLFVGDIMLGRQVAVLNKNDLSYNFKHWPEILEKFSQPDLMIGNLEGPMTKVGVKSSKSIQFRFAPKVAPQLKNYGFSGFSLANNHTYDQGKKNVEVTRKHLSANGLFYFGDEYKEDDTVSVSYQSVSGKTVAFIGFNLTEDGRDRAVPRLRQRTALIKTAKSKADYVIVLPHWGVEYQELKFSKQQQQVGHAFIDAGADAIIGTHPHVVQPLEVYQGKPIFYSLGNFIFDQYWSQPTQRGLVVGLVIPQLGDITWTLIPIQSIQSVPQLMLEKEEKAWLERFTRTNIRSN